MPLLPSAEAGAAACALALHSDIRIFVIRPAATTDER